MVDEFIRKQDAVDMCGGYGCLAHLMSTIKPADVAPVVHGKWMKEDRGHVEYCAVCDQCGFDWMWSDREYFKFCPNCGAKMDTKEKG